MKKTRGLFIIIAGLLFPVIVYAALLQIGRFRYNDACSSCHKMEDVSDRMSITVHRNIDCADCHRPVSKLSNMFAVRFMGRKPHGTADFDKKITPKCLDCHKKTWKQEHVFKKSILFSHERHALRAPECMICHVDSAHRKGSGPIAKPVSSAICKDCHAKRRHEAKVAHPPKTVPDLGVYEKQPHPPDWILKHHSDGASPDRNCAKCHKESYCKNCHEKYVIHGPKWRSQHGEEAQRDLAPCQVCHLPEGCADCHLKKLPKSHGTGWNSNHSRDLNVKDCMPCHRLNFCKACHTRTRPASHTDTMIRNHDGFSKGKEQVCAVCHEQNPCMDCHKIQMPHPAGWNAAHPKTVKSGQRALCENCHKKDYCAACHEKSIPKSHKVKKTWMKRHGKDARTKRSDCAVCHADRFCVSCHNLPMPHQRGWNKAHGAEYKLKPETCDICHVRANCDECHRKSKPASHADKTTDFRKRHGAMSQRKDAVCSVCHTKGFCEDCHGLELPHKAEFLRNHRATVKQKGESFCAKCHTKKYCADCHRNKAKHPAGWLKQHGGKAMDDSKSCLTCHEPADCAKCHSKPVSGGKMIHPDCTFCHNEKDMKFMGTSVCGDCHDDVAKQLKAVPVKQDCTLCHERHGFKASFGKCKECHDMSKAELHSKSDHSDCAKCHKQHTWKTPGRVVCTTCHVDKKDHYEPDDCWMCHPFKK